MTRFSLHSLRVRLLFIVLFAILPVLGLMLYAAAEQRQMAAAQAQEEALRLVRVASSNQENLIEETYELLSVMAQHPAIRSGDSAACNALFADLLKRRPLYANLGLIKPDGDLLCSAIPASGPISAVDRAYFQRALKTREFAAGDYQISRTTGKPSLDFGYPVLNEVGQVQVVLIAALDLAWLNQLVAAANLPLGETLTVIDSNGTVLARYPDPEKWVGQSVPEVPVVQTVLKRQGEGTVESTSVDGVPRFYAFRPLHGTAGGEDVYVYTGIPTKIVFAGANRLLVRNLAGLGLVTILVLAIAWVGSNMFLLRRVNALLDATQRLAVGDLGARTGLPYGQGELGQLARAFDEMTEVLEQRTVQLSQTEAKYRALVEQIPAVTYIATPDEVGKTLYMSPQVEAMLGFSSAEWIADPELWLRQIHPEDLQRVLNELTHSHASGEPFRSEYRLFARDGRVTWVHNEARLVLDETGQAQFLEGVLLDITERKQLEQEMAQLDRLHLVGEMAAGIGHEIRNPMTTIRGFLQILRSKKNCIQYKEYYDLMIEELDRANSIITEFLSLAKNRAVDLKTQNLNSIVKALSPLIQADAMVSDKYINIKPEDIPDLPLDEKEIRQIILNLARNGLEAMSPGEKLTIRTFTDGGEVVLAVQNQGKGIEPNVLEKIGTPFFTTKDNGTGLGLAVCYSIAARHNAIIKVETNPTGTTFYVRFKL